MKRKLAKIVGSALLISSFLFTPSIDAKVKPQTTYVQREEKNLKQTIDEILEPYSENTDFSIDVVSLKDGKTLYQHDENKKLIPASCLKLITSLVALKELGADYKFKTEFYTDGKIKDGIIDGNLYVKGYGDPSLVSEQLWLIVKELHNKGIKEIKGNIVADDSYFDNEKYSPGWYEETIEENKSKAYNAPSGALSLNFNTIRIYVKSGKKVKDKPTITLDPETKYLEIKNHAQTLQEYSNIKVLREEIDEKDVATVNGGIKLGKEKSFRINISKPEEYFLTVFKEFLESQGIEVKGNLEEGITPKKSKLILTHESKPLSLIIRDLCKYSNNFIADQIVKTLDAEINQKRGTNEGGVKILDNYLNKLGLKDYEIVDGSGYSLKNKLTAKHITKILEKAYNDFEVSPEFIAAQPIAGNDGSLQDRLYSISGEVRAKTGTIDDFGVSSVSGYVKTKDDILAFSILMNSKDLKSWQMKIIQDSIIENLTK